MTSLAVGVVVYERSRKLRELLDSIDSQPIDRVYVADNGDTEERASLYEREYPFELTVLDLPYDSGLGYGRHELAERLEEEYLLVVDNDMRVPSNVQLLVDQLEARPEFGGISGILREGDDIRSGCWDIFEEGLFGADDTVLLDIREQKGLETVAGSPLAEFDFVTNATVFRAACLASYNWNPELELEEHLDFYLNHKFNTEWRFGVCPAVIFDHDPGGPPGYVTHRNDETRIRAHQSRSLSKWGHRKRIYALDRGWLDTPGSRTTTGAVKRMLRHVLPVGARIVVDDLRNVWR